MRFASLVTDFKEMLFTSLVDLEERIDRRIVRVIKEIRGKEERSGDVSVGFTKPPLEKVISQLPEEAIVGSILKGENHIHSAHEKEQLDRLEHSKRTNREKIDPPTK